MTMYLPNAELHATGYEPAEFLEAHHADEPGERPVAEPGTRTKQRDVPTAHLDTQTRIDITRWAEEYISGLVENHHGDREDVRAVIDDLHHQTNVTADSGVDGMARSRLTRARGEAGRSLMWAG